MRGHTLKRHLEEELLCYEYINAIRLVEDFPSGLYGADKFREEAHDKLCEIFGLSKEQTKKYTDNLNLNDDRVVEKLYFALLDESRKNKTKASNG